MVLTAVVVTQVSVGGSLRATLDYVVGTLAGAVYAAAVGVLVPHVTVLGQAVALTLAVAPLALAAALRPSFRVAPFSAVLVPPDRRRARRKSGDIGGRPRARSRPWRGRSCRFNVGVPRTGARAGSKAASRLLRDMAALLPAVLSAFTPKRRSQWHRGRQNDLGRAVGAFDKLCGRRAAWSSSSVM